MTSKSKFKIIFQCIYHGKHILKAPRNENWKFNPCTKTQEAGRLDGDLHLSLLISRFNALDLLPAPIRLPVALSSPCVLCPISSGSYISSPSIFLPPIHHFISAPNSIRHSLRTQQQNLLAKQVFRSPRLQSRQPIDRHSPFFPPTSVPPAP